MASATPPTQAHPVSVAGMRTEDDSFRVERHGQLAVLIPRGGVESTPWEFLDFAIDMLLPPLLERSPPTVVVDLGEIEYFGSIFLALLLRIEREVRRRNGTMVLCRLSERAGELLRVTNLDTVWAIYDTRLEAIEALDED